MPNIAPCLWFDNQAEEAANFYVSVFKNSRVTAISHYGDGMPLPKGTVLEVSFELNGEDFLALNGGPIFTFSPAISFVVNCETQEEIDDLWTKLSADPASEQCRWLKDKYGVSWQIVPAILPRLMDSEEPEKRDRVFAALMKMKKLDIACVAARLCRVEPRL
ncbi:MAG TPA: VOC family protein [Beijerinckiaceae bacterium]|nr:VOC family protein [Beijerinckiaceae bacterium]